MTHGATKKQCSHEGCANGAVRGGFCVTHGVKMKQCSHEGCANRSKKGGVCITQSAKVKRCSNNWCANGAVFASRTARGLDVAASRGAPTEPSREAFASRTARR